jgi:hypothetical protein
VRGLLRRDAEEDLFGGVVDELQQPAPRCDAGEGSGFFFLSFFEKEQVFLFFFCLVGDLMFDHNQASV